MPKRTLDKYSKRILDKNDITAMKTAVLSVLEMGNHPDAVRLVKKLVNSHNAALEEIEELRLTISSAIKALGYELKRLVIPVEEVSKSMNDLVTERLREKGATMEDVVSILFSRGSPGEYIVWYERKN